MRIGVDFDNTLAGYDDVFVKLADELGLLSEGFEGGKTAVRDHIRSLSDGDAHWQRLQGQAYGTRMGEAVFFEGADQFLKQCQDQGFEVFIVSHKTRLGHFDETKVNLRDAAIEWMEEKDFFSPHGLGIAKENLYFEDDREKKIARINALSLDWFIDDLPEVLTHPDFPENVKAIVFGGASLGGPGALRSCVTWDQISREVFGDG